MGHADKLNFIDLIVASVRNTHGSEWRTDQYQAILNAIGGRIAESEASQNLSGLDVLGELIDEAAIQCERVTEYEQTAEDIAADRAEAKYEAKRDAALIGG